MVVVIVEEMFGMCNDECVCTKIIFTKLSVGNKNGKKDLNDDCESMKK